MPELIILAVVIATIAALIAVILIRTILFVPKGETHEKAAPIFVNNDKAVHDLAEMIKCKTISDRNKENESEAEFQKFEALLPTLFPNVYKTCIFEKVGERALLFRWHGRSADAPTVLMAHYDVVSVAEEDWEKPPFDAVIENGILWGRGTLDTKGSLNGILQAAEMLIAEGYKPENDIYLAFGGDEEINGGGAPGIVKLFKERGITPGAVLDEGGAIVEKVFPGVKTPCALIGIAEKGMLNVEYSVKGGGGHSSSPAPHTPVGRLSAACVRMEKHPFKFRITAPARQLFDTLGRRSTFLYRMIFANLWCFSPVLNLLTRKTGGELNALMRTTTAFTQMEGSKGMNVIPPYARMVSNHRIAEGDTVDSVVNRIRKTVKDDKIAVKVINGTNPTPTSDTSCKAWETIKCTVHDTWQDTIVSPYLMLACADARHWNEISDKVYRFSPMALSSEERATIHGNNERIPLATVAKTVEFYARLMKKI